MLKTKDEIMKIENEKKAEKIINAKAENAEKTAKATTIILDAEIKREFQLQIKKSGLNMSFLFNAFMKAYLKNPEIRKAVISEISE